MQLPEALNLLCNEGSILIWSSRRIEEPTVYVLETKGLLFKAPTVMGAIQRAIEASKSPGLKAAGAARAARDSTGK